MSISDTSLSWESFSSEKKFDEPSFSSFKSPFLKTLAERGFLYQMAFPEDLDEKLQTPGLRIYLGCDATASSLHVGNLVGLMLLKWAQHYQHHPLLLIGGGTSLIGDPSFRDQTRPLMAKETIAENIKGIVACYHRILGPNITLVNNQDWLGSLNYLEFLRDIGSRFSVNRLLGFEGIKTRLKRQQSLSFLELNYPLLQAYDFLHLYRHYDCLLQVGGSDQWGNLVSGIELIKKVCHQKVFALTWPLLATSSGQKMGKSANGAIWLNPESLPPYQYWQFWRSIEDADVVKFLKLYTMLPLETCEKFQHQKGEDLIEGKILLADCATAIAHGQEVLDSIHQLAKIRHRPFEGANASDACSTLNESFFQEARSHWPTYVVSSEETSIAEILTHLSFVTSRSQGRQKITQGGVKINFQTIEDPWAKLCAFSSGFKNPQGDEMWLISLGRHQNGILLKERKSIH